MKSSFGLYYQLIVTDNKTGKIVSKSPFRRSKSFVLQFLKMLEVQMYPAANVSITDYTDTGRSVGESAMNFEVEDAVGGTYMGTRVGTGTTPPDTTDTKLETPIAHGVGAGQLSYGAQSKTTTAEVGANVDFILTRTFNNGSGGTINVTEAVIYVKGDPTAYYCMVRDTFTAVPVLNAQTLTVNYTFRTTV